MTDTAGPLKGIRVIDLGRHQASGIDVLAPQETGGVVALGDSLIDANISTHGAYCRWPDQLARRLIARPAGRD
jgi:hypothetical protein